MTDSGILNTLVLNAHEALNEGVIMGDGNRVLHVNEAACALYGRSREELLRAGSLFGFLTEGEQARITALVDADMARGQPVPQRYETVILRPDGSQANVEMSTSALVDGGRTRTLTLLRDIGERIRQKRELERLALHDPLTGLPNRRLLMERLGRIAARAAREQVDGALFFLDLDEFKPINDVFGHDVGDRVLVAVADNLSRGMRSCDSVARLGGDEFVVTCERVDDDDRARKLGERLRSIVAAPIDIGMREPVSMGVSVGIRRFGGKAIDPEALLAAADTEMYREKSTRAR